MEGGGLFTSGTSPGPIPSIGIGTLEPLEEAFTEEGGGGGSGRNTRGYLFSLGSQRGGGGGLHRSVLEELLPAVVVVAVIFVFFGGQVAEEGVEQNVVPSSSGPHLPESLCEGVPAGRALRLVLRRRRGGGVVGAVRVVHEHRLADGVEDVDVELGDERVADHLHVAHAEAIHGRYLRGLGFFAGPEEP